MCKPKSLFNNVASFHQPNLTDLLVELIDKSLDEIFRSKGCPIEKTRIVTVENKQKVKDFFENSGVDKYTTFQNYADWLTNLYDSECKHDRLPMRLKNTPLEFVDVIVEMLFMTFMVIVNEELKFDIEANRERKLINNMFNVIECDCHCYDSLKEEILSEN